MVQIDFVKALVRHPVQTGAIAPSSEELAREMLKYWPRNPRGLIVEYGPGTGSFTREILERRGSEPFFAIERNGLFVDLLRREGVDVHDGSAADLRTAMDERQFKRASLVVSGLPWAVIAPEEQRHILEATYDGLETNGVFSTFAYLHSRWFPQAKHFTALLQATFRRVETSPVIWWNLPPAIIYHCFKGRRPARDRVAPSPHWSRVKGRSLAVGAGSGR